ncbi:unnamed protein product [Adineta steineri]|uniref:Uncharacterized protein n=1 Tax=Adineta steineri TaxID=433720 RepID=A0A819X1P4_9BILA|nr:unnamed protein product [Adineta steineri]CAF4135207.1 unnamed protein product [Adineta steineri]
MYQIVFFFLILGCWGDLKVLVNEKGEYQISIDNNPWLRSSRTALYVDNIWYSTDDNSLPLINISSTQGEDPILGGWNETQLNYDLALNGTHTKIVGRIRQWHSFSAITFHLETGNREMINTVPLDMNHVRTVFPSFDIEQIDSYDQRSFFTYEGEMAGDDQKHAGRWNRSAEVINAGMIAGPVVLSNLTQRGEKDVLVLSPFSRFMATSFSQTNSTLEYGVIGSMTSIPANYNHSMIVFYSSKGIRETIREWGQTMQKAYNRTNEHRLNDLTINYLGYYTDNGGYYYYHSEIGVDYERTMVNVRHQIPLPFHYMQLDSWWYYKGIGHGVSEYTAMRHIFPDGLQALHRRLENIPLAAHNRYWAYDNVYKQKYSFALDETNKKALPIGNDSFWLDFFTQTRDWGLILYEQDWLDHQTYDFTPLCTDIHLGQQWLTSMGAGAEQVGMNLQYCMSLPRHILTALEVPRVTQARASTDYALHLKKQTVPQWAIGISSMFLDALGIAPFKDVFWSTSVQPGAPYGFSPREVLPEREILIATLSTGPVGVGDGIRYINAERIMKCCRQDGLILKPDRPLTMIDVVISDWTFSNGVSVGELYSTQTTINNQTFHAVFASAMERDYQVYPSMIGAQAGVIWSYNNATDVKTFSETNSLNVSASQCNNLTVCLWYVSPLVQFSDSPTASYALLGEWNKWTAVSRQRFNSIKTDTKNSQVTIIVQGVAGETIPVVIYHSLLFSVTVNCRISTDDTPATVIITKSDIICS